MSCSSLEEIIRGDTVKIELTLSDHGAPFNVGGDKLYFTLKSSQTDADVAAALQYIYTIPSNPETAVGIVKFSIPATSTATVVPGTYYYDLQWKHNATPNEVYTIALGKTKVLYDVTITTA